MYFIFVKSKLQLFMGSITERFSFALPALTNPSYLVGTGVKLFWAKR